MATMLSDLIRKARTRRSFLKIRKEFPGTSEKDLYRLPDGNVHVILGSCFDSRGKELYYLSNRTYVPASGNN